MQDNWVDFKAVKAAVNMEMVLGRYRINWLRKKGEELRRRCPIHQGEGQDTFHVSLAKNAFHCFSCKARGNVLDFVAAMESSSIREAALRLQGWRDHTGMSVAPAANGFTGRKLVTKKTSINPPLSFTLALDRRHPYLARRGIEPATADHFGVGYFRGHGLMSGRIAIPIHDDIGRLVAYCGRTVDPVEPRYRFPAGFQKSQVLFHDHRARAAGGGQVIVVEGFFDCMRVYQAGFPCVVALMGARLSPAQKNLLAARFCEVVLLLDGDRTGRAATAQIASDLRPACSVTELLLPAGVQPDQMTTDEIRRVLIGEERRYGIGTN